MLRRTSAVVGLTGLVVAVAAGCGGGDPGPSSAMRKAVLDGCGRYLKPETVAATLGTTPYAYVDGRFNASRQPTGWCTVYVKSTVVGGATTKNAPFLRLEAYDRSGQGGPESYAKASCDPAQNPGYQIVAGPGPGLSCAAYRPDPPDASLQGGRLEVHGSVGRIAVTITIDGVRGDTDPKPTLKADRAHGFQLLADAMAAGQ